MSDTQLVPDDETEHLYRSMRTDELQRLHRAFLVDIAAVTSDAARVFADWRLRLIETILGERGEVA